MSSFRKGQQSGYDADRSMVEEVEMRHCRRLAREERITERVQDKSMRCEFGITSGSPKLLCGNPERRRAERKKC